MSILLGIYLIDNKSQSCRHGLNVVDWKSVEMFIERNPEEGLQTEKKSQYRLSTVKVEIILELGNKTSMAQSVHNMHLILSGV